MRFTSLSSNKVAAKAKFSGVPLQTDYAEYITGTITSEKAGVLLIEESYNLPVFPRHLLNALGVVNKGSFDVSTPRWETRTAKQQEELEASLPTVKAQLEEREALAKEASEKETKFIEEWASEGTWSLCTYPEGKAGETMAKFAVGAAKGISFATYAGAPFWRLSFEAGEEETKSVVAVARAFERGKV